MSLGTLRCCLCPTPIDLVAPARDSNAEPFVVTSAYGPAGQPLRNRAGRPVPAYAHAACWYAEQADPTPELRTTDHDQPSAEQQTMF